VPATRTAVGNKFPTLEDLSNGELTDAQVLAEIGDAARDWSTRVAPR